MVKDTIQSLQHPFPLHHAASCFAFKELQHLLWDQSAMDYVNRSYDILDAELRTPFHFLFENEISARLNQEAVLKCTDLLIHYSEKSKDKLIINGDSRCQHGSPLKLAVDHRMSYCVAVLLAAGAQPNRETALKIANTMPDIFLEMLDNGIEIEQRVKGITLDFKPIIQRQPEEHNDNQFVETEFLYSLLTLKNKETKRSILRHPLIKAFMELENNNFYFMMLFWTFIFSTAVYYVGYIAFTFQMYIHQCEFQENVNGTVTNVVISICYIDGGTFSGSLFFIICNFGWLMFDLRAQWIRRHTFIATWRVWVARIGNVIMMLPMWPGLFYGHWYKISWKYTLASIGMFFSCVSFLITVGIHHSVSIYIEMLFQIFCVFLKITLLFLPLLVGFYLGFLLLFSDVDPFSFIFTVVEGSIGYESKVKDVYWFDYYAHGFGVGFVILICIIFINFLLAISIDDLEKLRKEAEVMSLSKKVHGHYMLDSSPVRKHFSVVKNISKMTGSEAMRILIDDCTMQKNCPFDKELIREMFDLKSKEKSPTLQKL